ncbi:MAG: hypothetical protein QG641_1277 [Candidatus Poribacteria bacterium]|nr:hypothetical protein [Candidatus Poribacteria bacterium]
MVLLATLTKSVKISLSEEQYDNLRRLADKKNESVSSLIREILSDLLSQKKVIIDEKPKRKLRNHEAYGIWADREDMADSLEWVRKQRESWKERLCRSEQ